MNTVLLKHVEIGTGRPKVVVPLVEHSRAALLEKASGLPWGQFDLVEWRVDCYDNCRDTGDVLDTLKKLGEILGDCPMLATFRTKREGGTVELPQADYLALVTALADSGLCAAVDVELFTGDEGVCQVVETAHKRGTAVVGSSHDFERTPPQEELVARLLRQQALGCDILKLAVMPRCRRDVLTLLSATEEAARLARQPVVTMSMGGMGVVSRLCGEVFGSAMTFGAVGETSAPGQVQAERLNLVLDVIHESL